MAFGNEERQNEERQNEERQTKSAKTKSAKSRGMVSSPAARSLSSHVAALCDSSRARRPDAESAGEWSPPGRAYYLLRTRVGMGRRREGSAYQDYSMGFTDPAWVCRSQRRSLIHYHKVGSRRATRPMTLVRGARRSEASSPSCADATVKLSLSKAIHSSLRTSDRLNHQYTGHGFPLFSLVCWFSCDPLRAPSPQAEA